MTPPLTPARLHHPCKLFFCRAVLIGLTLALSACGTASPRAAGTSSAVTPSSNEVPTQPASPSAAPTPAAPPTITAAVPTPSAAPTSTPARPSYKLSLQFDYLKHHATVQEEIQYTSPVDGPLEEIDLVVEPNRYPRAFSLTSLALDGLVSSSFTLDGHRLSIPLAQPLQPGQGVAISLSYTLQLPAIPEPSGDSRPVPFGYTERQTNLVDWYPYVAAYRDGTGWLVHDPWFFGEHEVYDSSDYAVTLSLTNPIPGLVVAASSAAIQSGGSYAYQISAARTFALSISPSYVTTTRDVNGVTILGYAFPWDKAAGEKAVSDTAAAVALYGQLYGPYPHAALSVVEADFLDGMEYDGLFFLSRGFYNLYDGTSRGYLTAIAVHETAHQWWFGLVGDDQALEPWLDEAFATFNELVFYEHAAPDLVDWWWSVRVNYYQPSGWINHPIYDYKSFTSYRNAVYLRGAEFLADLRKQMGTAAFDGFMRDLAARFRGRQLTGKDFFAMMAVHTTLDLQPLIGEYFDPAVK